MIELITGRGPSAHVDSDDIGHFNASMFGKGSYIVDGCDLNVLDANTIQISPGGMLLEGRYVRIMGGNEEVKIQSGTSNMKRYDVIYAKYTRSPSDLIETVAFGVETGVPDSSSPAVPSVARGSILTGDTEVVVPIAQVLLDGLTPTIDKVLLDSFLLPVKPKLLWEGSAQKGAMINIPNVDNYTLLYVRGKSATQKGLCCPSLDEKNICISSIVRNDSDGTNYWDGAVFFAYILISHVSGTQYRVSNAGFLGRTQNSAQSGNYVITENGNSAVSEIWGVL